MASFLTGGAYVEAGTGEGGAAPPEAAVDAAMAWLHEAELTLTPREFSLLECFLRHPGVVLSRDQLLDAAWPYGVAVTPNTVDAYVHLLREKLGPDAGARIRTERGVGYRMAET